MTRHELIAKLFPDGVGRLWCPLLTHYYVRDGRVAVDRRRMAAHMRTLAQHMNRFLLASSTGDGWDLDPPQFNDLLAFARHESYWPHDARFLVGSLGRTTTDVVRRGQAIRSKLGENQAPSFAGIGVAPPVAPGATQEEIREHYRRAARDVNLPVAVYQVPQVTGCRIEPGTLAAIIDEHPNVIAFKDSSGTDAVADADLELGGLLLLRGVEGGYARSLKCGGGAYDSLLLGSANVMPYSLRSVIEMAVMGEFDLADRHAKHIEELLDRLLDAVSYCRTGNISSSVNRAVDHLLAHGMYWKDVEPPVTFDGSRMPREVIHQVATIYNEDAGIPERGYFVHREAILG